MLSRLDQSKIKNTVWSMFQFLRNLTQKNSDTPGPDPYGEVPGGFSGDFHGPGAPRSRPERGLGAPLDAGLGPEVNGACPAAM